MLGIALAACAPGSGQGPAARNATASGNDSDESCKEEAPTGSNITRSICRTREQKEADRKGAEDMFRKTNARPETQGPTTDTSPR